ncbi:MAG TPA: hypothetical protein PKZ97_13125 [Azospirillaceae bacterium]|nr:hypothetical protein [Azospirillaceae bacterium]HRQ82047.1 hypothetical protein [Azospirillaceae bacterium]
MSDAANEDARPLTKEERAQLADCLFRLYSAIYFIGETQKSLIYSLKDEGAISGNTTFSMKSYETEMREAVDLIDKLSKSFGVQVDG